MSQRTLLETCLGLLALSVLIAPTTLALGVDDVEPVDTTLDGLGLAGVTAAACWETRTGWKHGHFSANGYGTFPLEGEAYDGCGGEGCDDTLQGWVYTNDAWRPVYVEEQGRWGESCFVYCYYDGYSLEVDGVMQGHVSFVDPPGGAHYVDYNCGTSVSPGDWVFRGRLDLATDCEESHGRPACGEVSVRVVA